MIYSYNRTVNRSHWLRSSKGILPAWGTSRQRHCQWCLYVCLDVFCLFEEAECYTSWASTKSCEDKACRLYEPGCLLCCKHAAAFQSRNPSLSLVRCPWHVLVDGSMCLCKLTTKLLTVSLIDWTVGSGDGRNPLCVKRKESSPSIC